MIEKRPKYCLRKLSVGLASVMVGSVLFLNSAQEVHADATDNPNSAETSTETSVDKTPQNLNIVEGQHGTTAEQSTPETGSGGAGQVDRSLSNEESNTKNKPVDQKQDDK